MNAIEFITGRCFTDNQFIPVKGDAFAVRYFKNGKAKIIYARTFNGAAVNDVFWALQHARFVGGSLDFQDFQNSATGAGTPIHGGSNEFPIGYGEEVFSRDQFTTIFFPNNNFAGVYATYYENLPDVKTNLIGAKELLSLARRSLHFDNLCSCTGIGDYTDFTFTVPETKYFHLEGDKRYAIIGAVSSNSNCFIRMRGSCTGGLPIVLHNPNPYDERYSTNFLLQLSKEHNDLPIIPWFYGTEQRQINWQIFSFIGVVNADIHIFALEF